MSPRFTWWQPLMVYLQIPQRPRRIRVDPGGGAAAADDAGGALGPGGARAAAPVEVPPGREHDGVGGLALQPGGGEVVVAGVGAVAGVGGAALLVGLGRWWRWWRCHRRGGRRRHRDAGSKKGEQGVFFILVLQKLSVENRKALFSLLFTFDDSVLRRRLSSLALSGRCLLHYYFFHIYLSPCKICVRLNHSYCASAAVAVTATHVPS